MALENFFWNIWTNVSYQELPWNSSRNEKNDKPCNVSSFYHNTLQRKSCTSLLSFRSSLNSDKRSRIWLKLMVDAWDFFLKPMSQCFIPRAPLVFTVRVYFSYHPRQNQITKQSICNHVFDGIYSQVWWLHFIVKAITSNWKKTTSGSII